MVGTKGLVFNKIINQIKQAMVYCSLMLRLKQKFYMAKLYERTYNFQLFALWYTPSLQQEH